ncbi:MAG: thioesterase family protein, partial [Betaproteobacteria bacterium]
FYANYLKYFERARTEWLRSLGISQQALRDSSGGMFVVSETAVRYLRPARLDDELRVSAALTEMGRGSLHLVQQARLQADESLLCEATIRLGWVNALSLKPSRIPALVLQQLQASP